MHGVFQLEINPEIILVAGNIFSSPPFWKMIILREVTRPYWLDLYPTNWRHTLMSHDILAALFELRFEGKLANICMLVKSTFCFTGFSRFRILHFKQYTFKLCRNKFRFIVTLRIVKFKFFAETSGDLLSADRTPDIMDEIISEKWKFLREIR